jgi:hypothetical protein
MEDRFHQLEIAFTARGAERDQGIALMTLSSVNASDRIHQQQLVTGRTGGTMFRSLRFKKHKA